MHLILEVPEIEPFLWSVKNDLEPDCPNALDKFVYDTATDILNGMLTECFNMEAFFDDRVMLCANDAIDGIFRELCSYAAVGFLILDRDSVAVNIH